MALREDGIRPIRLWNCRAFWRERALRREARLIAPYLDAKFYLENNADVAAAGIDASYHYAKYGWHEGRDPSASFSTNGYLSAHPSVATKGLNPLVHFIRQGQVGGDATEPELTQLQESEISVVEGAMDKRFYCSSYFESSTIQMPVAEHFCRFGWREGKDPSPEFSTSYYLLTNPDVRERGINPFWHYLIAGKGEGRLPSHPGGWKHAVLSKQLTLEASCKEWLRTDPSPVLLESDALVAKLMALGQARRLFLSFGHDDYRATPGGVQLCVEIEESDAQNHGFDYLNIHPWQPLPKLAEPDDDYIVCLILNGAEIGAARISETARALTRVPIYEGPPEIVIHHLAGHAPERIAELAGTLRSPRAHLWLHDYFTLCTSYALQRNDITPCQVPAAASNACQICRYGAARQQQEKRMADLFDLLDMHVIAPSKVALDFWSSRTDLKPAACCVQPHVELVAERRVRPNAADGDRPVQIAFIGTPAPHKGWPVFLELQRRLAADDEYRFCFFGAFDPGIEGIDHVKTHVRATDPESTIRAIANHSVDIVLHWPSWPETFSFSTFESMGGGALVVTNADSGNVAAAVRRYERGLVLGDLDELYQLAGSGGLADLARSTREARDETALKAQFSAMTLGLMALEAAA